MKQKPIVILGQGSYREEYQCDECPISLGIAWVAVGAVFVGLGAGLACSVFAAGKACGLW